MNESIDKNEELDSGEQNPIVVVTGFGLFGDYKVNSSWQCVQQLKINGIDLIVRQVSVAYEDVDKIIEQIWTKYKPNLVIHCGVSSLAKSITLETRAVSHKNLYTKPDIYGRLPNCVSDNQLLSDDFKPLEANDCHECFRSGIDLQEVCDKVNQHFKKGVIKIGAELSSNAGRFLCEYIYRSSLENSAEKTAFIHVPDITDNCPLEDIFTSLELTIKTLIKEVLKNN